ncbi:hypothetical protein SHI21_17955 [Bacteriovorax sp. PP10]|uniref:Uncharacterized protein n=1 Tax=Bacteriovorax antarcticus TaxID=3088717 RepID=A0ABU5VYH4_9BACT|nr:hypothetical protein [Bacteriovorax sp. PP10]MEA9358123.1 hypothetical protein [Bacteriovorax sp. PP10]
MNKALLILMTLVTTPVFGEYRVYQYYVRSKVQNINPPNAQVVTSTLNPISYAAYNGGKLSVEVNLLRSWVCMGNTSHKDVCSISEGKELEGATQ